MTYKVRGADSFRLGDALRGEACNGRHVFPLTTYDDRIADLDDRNDPGCPHRRASRSEAASSHASRHVRSNSRTSSSQYWIVRSDTPNARAISRCGTFPVARL